VYPFFPRIMKTPEAWNGEVVDRDGALPSAGRLWTADTGGCEGMREVKDVRWNKKKGVWKVTAQDKKELPKDDGAKEEEEVNASRIREQLSLYEQTFLTFPHEALMRKAGSRNDAQEVKASNDALLKTIGKRGKKEGANVWASTSESPAPVLPLGNEPLFYDQLLALSGMVQRELRTTNDLKLSPDSDDMSEGTEPEPIETGKGNQRHVLVEQTQSNSEINSGENCVSYSGFETKGGDKKDSPTPKEESMDVRVVSKRGGGESVTGGGGAEGGVTLKDPTGGADSGAEDGVKIKGMVMKWAVEHVVRHGLCPYAAGVIDNMRIVVRSDITDAASARGAFLQEASHLTR
jgi:hypothetical protein